MNRIATRLLIPLTAMALAALLATSLIGSQLDRASAANIATVAAGAEQSCLINNAGNVQCWGGNYDGQLGIGTTGGNYSTPQDVLLPGPAIGLAVGRFHSCFLLATGEIRCAGSELWTGTGEGSSTPVTPIGLPNDIIQISATFWHTCAVTSTHDLYCWGLNQFGELGSDCELVGCYTPVEVTEVRGQVASVAAGRAHTCIITTSGTVRCWGGNAFGQLGNGATTDSASSVAVVGLENQEIVSISAALHTCVLTAAGAVKCWGLDEYGELGDGNTETFSPVPVDAVGLDEDVVAVTVGVFFTCVLNTDGSASCWGANDLGQAGWFPTIPIETPIPDSSIPHKVDGFAIGATAIDAGDDHTCAIVLGGVKCWGYGYGYEGAVDIPGAAPKITPPPTATATLTPTATPTPTVTPTPTKQPFPGDTDGDGCADQRENGSDPALGGLRNYKNPWDFYDVAGFNGGPKDGVIDLPNDVLGVIQHYGAANYEVRYDRGPSVGPHPWNMTAPDGVIDLANDVLGVIQQNGHHCV